MQTLKHLLVKARGAGERNCRPQIRQMSVRRRLRIPKPLFTKSLLRKLREPKALNTWQRTPSSPQRPRWGGRSGVVLEQVRSHLNLGFFPLNYKGVALGEIGSLCSWEINP